MEDFANIGFTSVVFRCSNLRMWFEGLYDYYRERRDRNVDLGLSASSKKGIVIGGSSKWKLVKKKNVKFTLRQKLKEKMSEYLHFEQPKEVEDKKNAAIEDEDEEEEYGDEPQNEDEALFNEEER
ncbi:hypothetical protein Q3G72_026314 [Acer saccharum]|nr:hypothetical protein Q3G72_026314 [Acer saccharum]